MHRVYDEIAESWYGLRHWTRFRQELDEAVGRWKGGRLLNVGCAHGPDFLPFAGRFELFGVDFSRCMVEFARKYGRKHGFEANLLAGDAGSLPFATGSFDYAVSVAVYHNITGRGSRKKAFAELRRVLKPGGEAFLTVWNRWQPGFWFAGKEVMLPLRTKNGTVKRYYYLYSRREFIRDLEQAGLRVLAAFPERSYVFPLPWFSRNICVLVEKPHATIEVGEGGGK